MVRWLEGDHATPVRALERALAAWVLGGEIGEEPVRVPIPMLVGRDLRFGESVSPVLPCRAAEGAASDTARHGEEGGRHRHTPNDCREHDARSQAASAGTRRASDVRRLARIGITMLNVVPTPGVLSH